MGSDQVYTHSEEQVTSPVVGGQHNMNSVVFLKAFVLLHFISPPTLLGRTGGWRESSAIDGCCCSFRASKSLALTLDHLQLPVTLAAGDLTPSSRLCCHPHTHTWEHISFKCTQNKQVDCMLSLQMATISMFYMQTWEWVKWAIS